MTPKIIPLLLLLDSPLLCPAQTTPAPEPLDLDVKPIILPNEQAPPDKYNPHYLHARLEQKPVAIKTVRYPNS